MSKDPGRECEQGIIIIQCLYMQINIIYLLQIKLLGNDKHTWK